jgi:thiosulfate reductase cytochrome b subunit
MSAHSVACLATEPLHSAINAVLKALYAVVVMLVFDIVLLKGLALVASGEATLSKVSVKSNTPSIISASVIFLC